MKKTTLLLSLIAVSAASLVWAHGSATGIVKERMDGMVAMSKATKAITPMMRGNVEYNAEAIRDYARTIEEHAGEAMTKLFPEGSGGMPSEAKDDVWTDWEQFEVLAMQLESLGKGLGAIRVKYNLSQPVAITDIQENDATMVAAAVNPAAKSDFLIRQRLVQLAAIVATHHGVVLPMVGKFGVSCRSGVLPHRRSPEEKRHNIPETWPTREPRGRLQRQDDAPREPSGKSVLRTSDLLTRTPRLKTLRRQTTMRSHDENRYRHYRNGSRTNC